MMNEQKLKDLAAEFAKGIKTEDDLNQFTRLLTKLTVETALNAELTEHLGHEKNARKHGSNAHNGYSSKTILSDDGEIEITTPRDRDGTFEPQLIKKNQTRITQMDSQILSLYAKGMTTNEIVNTFKEMYDTDVSPTLISKANSTAVRMPSMSRLLNGKTVRWMRSIPSSIWTVLWLKSVIMAVSSTRLYSLP
ncbi:transposase [Acinetobacter sp. HR7]|jgi:putative transposase|nr:transposase [Acinetobacter sp. HR7]